MTTFLVYRHGRRGDRLVCRTSDQQHAEQVRDLVNGYIVEVERDRTFAELYAHAAVAA